MQGDGGGLVEAWSQLLALGPGCEGHWFLSAVLGVPARAATPLPLRQLRGCRRRLRGGTSTDQRLRKPPATSLCPPSPLVLPPSPPPSHSPTCPRLAEVVASPSPLLSGLVFSPPPASSIRLALPARHGLENGLPYVCCRPARPPLCRPTCSRMDVLRSGRAWWPPGGLPFEGKSAMLFFPWAPSSGFHPSWVRWHIVAQVVGVHGDVVFAKPFGRRGGSSSHTLANLVGVDRNVADDSEAEAPTLSAKRRLSLICSTHRHDVMWDTACSA